MITKNSVTDITRRLNQDYMKKHPVTALPAIGFLITDQAAQPCPQALIAALPPDMGVIFRDYHHPDRAGLGRNLRALCRERGLLFLVAGDIKLAETLAADGMHLPQAMMGASLPIRHHHPDWPITVACHDPDSLAAAARLPVDAALISPVFPTLSHPEPDRATLGLSGVRALVAMTSLPLYGLGGITNTTAPKLFGSGLAGLAAIRGFQANI